ncbi:MAG: hypothetical protein ACTSRS_03540 [Candidatus Helarchaeota archaeon]
MKQRKIPEINRLRFKLHSPYNCSIYKLGQPLRYARTRRERQRAKFQMIFQEEFCLESLVH